MQYAHKIDVECSTVKNVKSPLKIYFFEENISVFGKTETNSVALKLNLMKMFHVDLTSFIAFHLSAIDSLFPTATPTLR